MDRDTRAFDEVTKLATLDGFHGKIENVLVWPGSVPVTGVVSSDAPVYVPSLVICKRRFCSSSYLETGIKMVNANGK